MQKILTVIPVVAAALVNPGGQILLQRRPPSAHHGGLWEFPGGKIEPGDWADAALVRELFEELGITVEGSALESFSFAARRGEPVLLLLYLCRAWQGLPRALAAAELGWFEPAVLAALPMPPLDIPLAVALVAALALALDEGQTTAK